MTPWMFSLSLGYNGFPGGSDGKESDCDVGDPGSIPGSGRSPGEKNGTPFQYSCLGNSTDRGVWGATVHRVAKSQTRLSDFSLSKLLYNAVLISAVQQSKSAKYIYIFSLSWTSLPPTPIPTYLGHHTGTEMKSLCDTGASH